MIKKLIKDWLRHLKLKHHSWHLHRQIKAGKAPRGRTKQ